MDKRDVDNAGGGSAGAKDAISGEKGSVKGKGRSEGETGLVEKCMCPNCGWVVSHDCGESCMTVICPRCGSQMMRG